MLIKKNVNELITVFGASKSILPKALSLALQYLKVQEAISVAEYIESLKQGEKFEATFDLIQKDLCNAKSLIWKILGFSYFLDYDFIPFKALTAIFPLCSE
jgi:hypothetical protein